MTTLKDIVEFNPRTVLNKSDCYPFVAMEELDGTTRSVYGKEQRIYSGGGTKFFFGDTLFARITPCLENGNISQYRTNSVGFGSTEFIVFRNKVNISDPTYIYYLSRTYYVRKHAENSMTGASGRQRAELDYIKTVPCPLYLHRKYQPETW